MEYFITVRFTVLTAWTGSAIERPRHVPQDIEAIFSRSTQSQSQFLTISLMICHDFVIESSVYRSDQFERVSLDSHISLPSWSSVCPASAIILHLINVSNLFGGPARGRAPLVPSRSRAPLVLALLARARCRSRRLPSESVWRPSLPLPPSGRAADSARS